MINRNIGYIICESEGISSAVLQPKLLNGKAIAECILQTADEKNRNGRYYSEEELFPQLTAPRTLELLRSGTLRAECGHPLSKDLQRQSTIDDTKTCARFLKLWTEGKNIKAHVVGTNSELGRAFDLDLKEGVLPAWSLRALGSIEQTRRGCEVKNLRLITWDNVIYPSHPGAYTQGLVTESSSIVVPKTKLQSLVESTNLISGNDTMISETNDLNCSAILSPMNNEDVIRYIQSSSENLKFVRECFDFAYNSIQVNEAGTKVVLTTNDGDVMYVNVESYIHDELMKYNKNYGSIREASEENFSILNGMKKKSIVVEKVEEPIEEEYLEEGVLTKIVDFAKAKFSTSVKPSIIDDENRKNTSIIKQKFDFSKLKKLSFNKNIKGINESVEDIESLEEGLFFGKKKDENKGSSDPNFPIKIGKYNLALVGQDSYNRPIYVCKQLKLQEKNVVLFTSEHYSFMDECNLEIGESFIKFTDSEFKSLCDSCLRTIKEGATISSYKGLRYAQSMIYKNKDNHCIIEIQMGIKTSIENMEDSLYIGYYHDFNEKKDKLYICDTNKKANDK